MKFSILTATFNRANYLEILYRSLVNNSSEKYEIEWLIMDDGSTDNTEDVCRKFNEMQGLNIKYFKQENQGKMSAINNLSEYVTGDLWIECDSDDFFLRESFDYLYDKKNEINNDKGLYAWVFLKKEGDSISGNYFNKENTNTTMFDLYFKDGIEGEKIIVFDANIRKNYRYRIENGEKFCTEARLYHEIDKKYKIKCYNKCIVEGVYHDDGYTKNMDKIFINNPVGFYEYFREILERDTHGIKMKKRIYVVKHYILFSTIIRRGFCVKGIKSNINKMIYVLLYIPGKLKSKKLIKKWKHQEN